MAKYSASTGQGGTPQAMTTTYKTLVSVHATTGAATLRRGWIYEFGVGADGTPADVALVAKADRQTAAGTATAITPTPIDGADAAASLTGNANHTAEPTVTDNTELVEQAFNLRAGYRWVAVPESELVVPATNLAGVGIRVRSPSYTGTMVGYLHFKE